MMVITKSNINPAIQLAASAFHRRTINRFLLQLAVPFPCRTFESLRVRAFSTNETQSDDPEKHPSKPSICTADELHYVTVSNSDWRLALWRYNPPPKAPSRNHPLLLLSGVGTNAIGYDLSPESSFARHMSGQGFDTWVLEVRGAGLSMHGSDCKEAENSSHAISEQIESAAENVTNETLSSDQLSSSSTAQGNPEEPETSVVSKETSEVPTPSDKPRPVTEIMETSTRPSQRNSGFLSKTLSVIMSGNFFNLMSKLLKGFSIERFCKIRNKYSSLLETKRSSGGVVDRMSDLSQKMVDTIDKSQRSISPQLFDLQKRLSTTVDDFQKQFDLIVKNDWDFDHYLEEDIPAVMEYIRAKSKPKDGRLLAVGHSMGGILLYAMLSRYSSEGRDPGLAAVVTLASSLDYTSSKSILKLLVPLADPARALNLHVIPLGALLSAVYPLSSRAPYVLSWMNELISAQDMMHPKLLKKLCLNNFCTIPTKLLVQLTSAFREGGLRDRSGKFMYKDHLHKSNVPILALAGDRDLICPTEAVYETVKLIPEQLVTFKEFGEADGPHYAHYDLVGGHMAVEQLYPCIVEFLGRHDGD